MTYPAKILVAWAEAIGGNAAIRDWLMKNGYPELGLFVHALYLQDHARDWLMKNGHPHLMAIIRGAEGDNAAVKWLETHGYTPLSKIAMTGDGDDAALHWLKLNGHPELAMVAIRLRAVKDRIESDNVDHHKFNPNS
ncbi:MAG: hypothetical protein K9J06_13495 [Flavobacteriales bacterium]|nr:hypothetical protein [Flavobacteriales bacterium]